MIGRLYSHFLVLYSYRKSSSNRSQNSTKTLASSDVEGSPVLGQNEDIYGFSSAQRNQQERLQKRNSNIKQNLSFKSQEKTKRPTKQNHRGLKHKSKSEEVLDSNNSKDNKDRRKKTRTNKPDKSVKKGSNIDL